MENICVITDFEEIVSSRRFEKIETPSNIGPYTVYSGGNFFFISNEKIAVRFHQKNFNRQVEAASIETWISKIKALYPKF